jgi:hypothetical protein
MSAVVKGKSFGVQRLAFKEDDPLPPSLADNGGPALATTLHTAYR